MFLLYRLKNCACNLCRESRIENHEFWKGKIWLSHSLFWPDIAFKGTVVNLTCLSKNGGSLNISSTLIFSNHSCANLLRKRNHLYLNTGCPNKHGNTVTNSISSLLWISIVIPNFKSHSISMSARVYFMKKVKDCKDVSIMSPQAARWTVKADKFTLFVNCNFLVLLSTTVCSQNINKQIVNIADKTLTNYSFLSRYHYTKSKNYLKRRYRILY